MKQHEMRAINGHPLTTLLRNVATARRPPTRSEIVAEMTEAGLTEEQIERAVTLARAVHEERRENGHSSWSLRQAADEVSLAILKEWSAKDSLDGKHQLYAAHYDEEPIDVEVADELATRQVDAKHGRREQVTFEDGRTVWV